MTNINPRSVLYLDAGGALLTAVLVWFLVPFLDTEREILPNQIQVLGGIGAFCFLFSSSFAILVKKNFGPALGIIALVNTAYCALTAYWIFFSRSNLSPILLGYFAMEVTAISAVVWLEIRVIQRLHSG